MKIWEPKTPGTLWATPGLLRDSFTFYSSTLSLVTLCTAYVVTCLAPVFQFALTAP